MNHSIHQAGPPFQPPPRTSSNQPRNTYTAASSDPDRAVPPRKPVPSTDRVPPAANVSAPQTDRPRTANSTQTALPHRERTKDDTASAAAAAARSRRKAAQSPREDDAQLFPSGSKAPAQRDPHASSNHSHPAPETGTTAMHREGSTIINRVVVTDPQVDVERERERLVEARPATSGTDITPVTGLGLVGEEGVDDGGRGAGKSRQDHSNSASRRKETRFGEYILGQTLGEGEFGKVKMGWKKEGGVQVAIKLIRRESLGTNPSRLPKIYREISILRELSHPNIVRLHEMVETDRHIGIILEYASGGELFDYILNHRYLKDQAARRLFAQLVSGVGYLHKKGIVHRDLKLENLLLDRNRNIIITDFGFANTFDPFDELGDEIEYNLSNKDFVKRKDLERVRDTGYRRGDLMQTSCGSPCYAAPELVVSDSLYTGRKVDVWSCGVILYAMLAGYLPFDDDPANPEGDNINLLYKYIVSTPLTFPEYVTPHARDLLRRILVPDPRKRADLFEVARHSWLSEYAHVVSFITSSTTTTGDISTTTVTAGELDGNLLHTLAASQPVEVADDISRRYLLTYLVGDHQEVPLLARSASVREPSKGFQPPVVAIGGLSQKHGNVDPHAADAQPKSQRDAKRRTVQVEYVAPQSQTVRGEPALPASPPGGTAAVTSRSSTNRVTSESRGESGTQPYRAAAPKSAGRTTSSSKPLPSEPSAARSSQQQHSVIPSTRTSEKSQGMSTGMKPPSRPTRGAPRSVSDSAGAFDTGATPANSTQRPATGGSIAAGSSTGGPMNMPSRGSYTRPVQPVAPTVAAMTAHGKLAQPKGSKQYIISNPIPQSDNLMENAAFGRPNSMAMPSKTMSGPRPPSQSQSVRTHKRSNTVGGIGEKLFGRIGSFGGPSSQRPQVTTPQKSQKSYPPTSMPAALAPSNPRTSTDSRRSSSFGFGRKNSGLQDKSRRFSLLGSNFSLKNFGGSSSAKDYTPPGTSGSTVDHRDAPRRSTTRGRGPQVMAFGRGQSRSPSRDTMDSARDGYDGQYEQNASRPVQPGGRKVDGMPASHQPPGNSQYYATVTSGGHAGHGQHLGPDRTTGDSALMTESESSLNMPQGRAPYPAGFNSSEDDQRRQQGRWGRGPSVLQKNNRKFVDAYEQEQDGRFASSGHNSGSSGAARKVMDFFRRRGKARTGDER
ncbi:MAG: hypothetical protein M1817_000378 [Caeruleum heppii]|nr:MAG: hypothetical protein M1817_000378 [Caeruleum heppii]